MPTEAVAKLFTGDNYEPARTSVVISLSKAVVSEIPDKVYHGSAVEPEVAVALDGKTLEKGTDYTVSYVNNTKVGTATAIITGKGKYAGVVKKAFTIKPWEPAAVSRIAGDASADTAAAISAESFPAGSEWVIIARDDDFADAMSASGLAGCLNCPIVLTDRYGLSAAARAEVKRLGATKAYIIGGTGAIPGDLEGALAKVGCTVQARIYGNECWDTSVECAKKIAALGGSSDAIVAMSLNFQDALSISSFAYKYKVPIYLQTQEGDRPLPSAAVSLIKKASGKIYVPGGPGAVKESTVEGVFGSSRVVRIYGNDGYDTSNQIAAYMVSNGLLSAETVCIACGAQDARGTDALAGAALAGSRGGVMLLANANESMEPARLAAISGKDSKGAKAFLAANAKSVGNCYILGGAYVMPASFVNTVKGVLGV